MIQGTYANRSRMSPGPSPGRRAETYGRYAPGAGSVSLRARDLLERGVGLTRASQDAAALLVRQRAGGGAPLVDASLGGFDAVAGDRPNDSVVWRARIVEALRGALVLQGLPRRQGRDSRPRGAPAVTGQLHISAEWERSDARLPLLRRSWARIVVRVDDTPLTRGQRRARCSRCCCWPTSRG